MPGLEELTGMIENRLGDGVDVTEPPWSGSPLGDESRTSVRRKRYSRSGPGKPDRGLLSPNDPGGLLAYYLVPGKRQLLSVSDHV